jgi:hypothetical protein
MEKSRCAGFFEMPGTRDSFFISRKISQKKKDYVVQLTKKSQKNYTIPVCAAERRV